MASSDLRPPIVVTSTDVGRLYRFIGAATDRLSYIADYLSAELERAIVLEPEAVESRVVTMRSWVLFKVEETGETHEMMLVYPGEEDVAAGKVSVFTRIGSALLGLSEGQSIAWDTAAGERQTVTIIKVLFQPEAAGRYDL